MDALRTFIIRSISYKKSITSDYALSGIRCFAYSAAPWMHA